MIPLFQCKQTKCDAERQTGVATETVVTRNDKKRQKKGGRMVQPIKTFEEKLPTEEVKGTKIMKNSSLSGSDL